MTTFVHIAKLRKTLIYLRFVADDSKILWNREIQFILTKHVRKNIQRRIGMQSQSVL